MRLQELTRIAFDSFPLSIGLSPRSLQSIRGHTNCGKAFNFCHHSFTSKSWPSSNNFDCGLNFDASLTIACVSNGHVTVASFFNSKYFVCPNMIFPPGNVTVTINCNDLVLESFVLNAASAARVVESKAMNVSGKFLRVLLHVDTKVSASKLHASINGNHLMCLSDNLSVICDYHHYFIEQHYMQFLLIFTEHDILGEIQIDQIQPINIVEFIIPSSNVWSTQGSLIYFDRLHTRLQAPLIYLAIRQFTYDVVICKMHLLTLLVRPTPGSYAIIMQSSDTVSPMDMLQFFAPISIISVWPVALLSALLSVDLFLCVDSMDWHFTIRHFECVIQEVRFPALKLNQSHVKCQVYVNSSSKSSRQISDTSLRVIISNVLVVDVMEATISKVFSACKL